MTGPTIYIPFGPLAPASDLAALQRISPEAQLLTVPYDVPHSLRHERDTDPDGVPARAQEPVLTGEQAAAFAAADVLIALDTPRDLLQHAPRVRWLQAIGSGTGHLRCAHLEGSAVTVTNAAGVGSPAIAEWVLGRILQIYKRFDAHAESQRAHQWAPVFGDLVAGKRVAVVGFGAIGQDVARRCAALGMSVTAVRRHVTGREHEAGAERATDVGHLLEVAAQADVIVAAVPGTTETDDIFDSAFFRAVPAGGVFVNVGRGNSVVEPALIQALTSGHLRAAAIDVARQEPLPADSPLWDTPNLSISPHASTAPAGYMPAVWRLFLDNFAAWTQGRPLRNQVSVDHL